MLGAVAVFLGSSRERIRGVLGASAAIMVGVVGADSPARADGASAAVAVASEPETHAPPPRRAYIQYGVAFTVEGVVYAGPVCADPNTPCILGSGGGIQVGVGWRPTEDFYLGGYYEFSKQDPNKLFRLAILQQAGVLLRYYFPTGKSIEPFVLLGAGVAGYGNEWDVATWGPTGALGGGIELEVAPSVVVDVSLAYRPIFFRSFVDSIPEEHAAGIAHFISLAMALEAQDTL
jgi:hypothetical protein